MVQYFSNDKIVVKGAILDGDVCDSVPRRLWDTKPLQGQVRQLHLESSISPPLVALGVGGVGGGDADKGRVNVQSVCPVGLQVLGVLWAVAGEGGEAGRVCLGLVPKVHALSNIRAPEGTGPKEARPDVQGVCQGLVR